MTKLLYRYLIYFGIFVVVVQLPRIFNITWFKPNIDLLTSSAPLFLSVLLIDITYRIGKRQNEISEQQTAIQKRQYQIEKFNNYKDLHRDIYKCKCLLDSILPKIYEYFVAADRSMQNNSINEYIEQLTKLLFDIQNRVSDAMLRGDTQLNVKGVQDLLGGVGALLIKASQNPQLGMNKFDWVTTIINSGEFRERLTKDEQVDRIDSITKDPGLKAGMVLFVKRYREVFEGENNILAQLQKLYNE